MPRARPCAWSVRMVKYSQIRANRSVLTAARASSVSRFPPLKLVTHECNELTQGNNFHQSSRASSARSVDSLVHSGPPSARSAQRDLPTARSTPQAAARVRRVRTRTRWPTPSSVPSVCRARPAKQIAPPASLSATPVTKGRSLLLTVSTTHSVGSALQAARPRTRNLQAAPTAPWVLRTPHLSSLCAGNAPVASSRTLMA